MTALNQFSLKQQIELQWIRDDAEFFTALVLHLNNEKLAGVLVPNVIPYFSLFVVETHQYFQENFGSYKLTLPNLYEPIIRQSRLRIKFFEDRKEGVEGVLENFRWVLNFFDKWFIQKHVGFLARFKKLIQKDLGIFFYEEHIIGSSHTGVLNIGYRAEDLPNDSYLISQALQTLTYNIGIELGKYATHVISFPELANLQNHTTKFNANFQAQLLGYKDEKSGFLLTKIFNRAESNEADLELINLILFTFLTQINFLLYIFNNLIAKTSYTVFKIKFITLYHIYQSLNKLQNYGYPNNPLSITSKNQLKLILNDSELKTLVKQAKFRNILTHYTIDKGVEKNLSSNIELYGLVEHFFNGKSYIELSELVEKQLQRISILLEAWLNWPIKPYQIQKW
jgi:hypothetical protein